MQTRFQKFVRFFKALRHSEYQGDIAILKADAFGATAPEGIDARLDEVRGYLPDIDMDSLRQLPDGTLGREFARMLDDKGLKPFTLSPEIKEEITRHTFIARYIATHDMLHVLTGFDTSYAGEMGVLAVTVAQGFAPGGSVQEWSARLLYPLFSPSQIKAIRHNRKVGHAIGQQASFLLGIPFEAYFDKPVDELRRLYNLPEPSEAGVIKIHTPSLLPSPL